MTDLRVIHGDAEAPGRLPSFSDEALALAFAERHAADLRYVAAWGRWLKWDGRCWHIDDTLAAFDLVRTVCREAAAGCGERSTAVAVARAATVAAVERLARADRRLAAIVDQWDADPWLLNTTAGVVDLRTGETREHLPVDHMRKITAVDPSGLCPTWLAFLARITGEDTELQAFLQRIAGYALTGSTREHALFFLFGTGSNGKSTFLTTLAGILADYHRTAAIETFVASGVERHPTDLAGLQGARLVTAVETEEGRRWAEAKIKALTGGDAIAARFMRQDFFQFTPAFKLMIAGNHRPGLRSVDEAIRRRFHLIPFDVTIGPAERDPTLSERLRAEWPGILAWAIQGCAAWQRGGLLPPARVRAATETYLAAEDQVAEWMTDCCQRDPRSWTSSAELFRSWSAWSRAAGTQAGTAKTFGQELEGRGFDRKRTPKAKGHQGLRLTTHEADDR